MSLTVEQSQSFEASAETGVTGLVGTIEVAVVDNDGATVIGPASLNITENMVGGTPTGNYTWNALAAPAAEGQYQILWSTDGTFDPVTVISEDLLVLIAGAAPTAPPLVPAEMGAGPSTGPCTGWVSSEDVADCCSAEVGSDFAQFDDSVTAASELLYALSAHQFPGICQRTVRPCDRSRSCGVQLLSRGHLVYWDGYGSCWCEDGSPVCSCSHLSRVLLPNYPVREIVEVLIDGVVIDPSGYRLDGWQYLTRMRDAQGDVQTWPSCQALDLPSDEPGTFEVTYTSGMNPPVAGVLAAKELACQAFLACSPTLAGECVLPAGATRITRQGLTIDLSAFRGWGFDRKLGWRTGLRLVDAFLNSFNPNGLRRRPLIWSPDGEPYAEEVGTMAGS